MRKYHPLILCLLLLGSLSLKAQYKLESSQILADSRSWYDTKNGLNNSGILNGEYLEVKRISTASHQFFVSEEWYPGQIYYRGQLFDSLYMTYDIDQDVLLIRHPTSFIYHNQAIKLIQPQVKAFELRGSLFEYINESVGNKAPGFYEILSRGDNISLIAKRHKKTVIERTIEFEVDDFYYFNYEDTYHRIKRKGSILKVFKSKKSDIKSFISKRNLKISPGNDADIIELMSYIDQQFIVQPE